jgi:hypothetical protein
MRMFARPPPNDSKNSNSVTDNKSPISLAIRSHFLITPFSPPSGPALVFIHK